MPSGAGKRKGRVPVLGFGPVSIARTRVDFNDGCFSGLFQYFLEISVFIYLPIFSWSKKPKFRENTKTN